MRKVSKNYFDNVIVTDRSNAIKPWQLLFKLDMGKKQAKSAACSLESKHRQSTNTMYSVKLLAA